MVQRSLLIGLVCAVVLLMQTSSARAAIVSGAVTGGTAGGTFVDLSGTTLGDVGRNADHQSNNLAGFNEKQDFTLTSVLSTNAGILSLPAGTKVASHYILFNPAGTGTKTVSGWVTFNSNILAIITKQGRLTSSNFLGDPSAIYHDPADLGLEAGDTFSFSGNKLNITGFSASNPGDNIRVLTAAVPEPATMVLLGIGLAGIGMLRRKNPAA